MTRYKCTFNTNLSVVVEVDADDDYDASDVAWDIAEAYTKTLGTQTGSSSIVSVDASFDGIGADTVEEVSRGR